MVFLCLSVPSCPFLLSTHIHTHTHTHPSLTPLSIAAFQVVQVLRAIDRDEGGNDSTVYFSIPPDSSVALNFSVRDSGGRSSIFPFSGTYLLIPPFLLRLFISLAVKALNPTFSFHLSLAGVIFHSENPLHLLHFFLPPTLPVSARLYFHPLPNSGAFIVLFCRPPLLHSPPRYTNTHTHMHMCKHAQKHTMYLHLQ